MKVTFYPKGKKDKEKTGESNNSTQKITQRKKKKKRKMK
jgi:hypothetical protein